MRNEEPNKRFIGLQWSTISNLLDSIFGELFFAQKDSIQKLLVKIEKELF